MKNKKGQALVEFIIILPIFIFMLLSIIDIGKFIYFRNEMESSLSLVVDLYKNEKSYNDIMDELCLQDEEMELVIKNEDNKTITFSLKKKIDIITPGLNVLFPREVEVSRVSSYES